MWAKLSSKPSAVLVTIVIALTIYACSKSGGYGNSNNGGNNNGDNVSIKDFYFSVTTLTISSGTAVTWTNNDAVTHTVTADDNSFNSGDIGPGATYSRTFTNMGTFAYHCKYHSSMKATVVVK